MNTENCQHLLNIETVSTAFQSDQNVISDQVLSCLYSCYHPLFLQWAKITYKDYEVEVLEFAVNNAFTDAVIKFRSSAQLGELYNGKASLKTVFLTYCRNILKGYLKTESRLATKKKRLQIHLQGEYPQEVHDMENRFEVLEKALGKMNLEDRRIILWRHIDGKGNDEIASLLAITVPSATNRIYRCMVRLKELIENIEKTNNG